MVLPDFNFEKSLLPVHCRFVLGVDEVGRGPWAGPLCLTGFLLDLKTFNPADFIKLSVRDSKKLSPAQRQKIFKYIKQNNYSTKTVMVDSTTLDQQGISSSLKSGLTQILNFYRGNFDLCLLDGNTNFNFPQVLSVINGDSQCFSIATASIVAKVSRDALMAQYDLLYPQYGFKQHKGYGTSSHLQALIKHGVCPIHRLSFKPVKKIATAF